MKNVVFYNGVEIPIIGLGVFLSHDGEETENAVKYALDAGYRHIDTAMIYKNERSVGRAIISSGIKRGEVFITTKLWNDDIRSGDFVEAFDKSLEELQTNYIDLYLIHWPVDNFDNAWAALENLYNQKKVRAIGVSNFQQNHLEALMKTAKIKPMVNQIESHPLMNNQRLIDYCHNLDIQVQAWSPFARAKEGMLENEVLVSIAKKYNKTTTQVILAWDIARNIIALPKSVNKDRIISNIDVFDFELSKEDMEAINKLNQNKRIGPDPDNFDF